MTKKKQKREQTVTQRKETRYLECVLTVDEIRDAAEKLAALTTKQIELENEKASAAKQFAAQIASVSAEAQVYARKINAGREHRNVDVVVTLNFSENLKSIVRCDTSEIISETVIPESERQTKLDLPVESSDKLGAHRLDTQKVGEIADAPSTSDSRSDA